MLPLKGFCKHAVWLFGVLVGLAIKEAITRVAPHLLVIGSEPWPQAIVEMMRLVVFGVMIVRHYLGAAHMFDNVHAEQLDPVVNADGTISIHERERVRIAGRQFGVDFFAGLLHFTAFSVLALTLELHSQSGVDAHLPSERVFRFVLMFILCYDVAWIVTRPGPHPRELKIWTLINFFTAIVYAASFWYMMRRWASSLRAEVIPDLFVVAVSVIDIATLTMGTEFFSKLAVFIPKFIGERLGKIAEKISNFSNHFQTPDQGNN